jgi:hypothetical protein
VARIHLAWELGNGLGHVARLTPVAVELARRGHEVSMSMRDLVATRALWLPLDLPCVQAPVFLHQTVGLPRRSASLAEIALGFGYLDGDVLDALHEGWRALLSRFDADLVVGDFAPTAMLAARSLGTRAISVGLSFAIPPHGRPLPPFRPDEPLDAGRLESAEARVVRAANHALRASDAAPVRLASEVFRGERALLCTWPELDCYARGDNPGESWFGINPPPGGGEAPAWPEGDGPRVFAYLKGSYPELALLLRTLAERGCRTLCYIPDVEAGAPAPLVHPGIAYSTAPVDLTAAFIECDLCVCHAGGGTIGQSLLAGVPLLLLPMQTEQELNARAVVRLGAGTMATRKMVLQLGPTLDRALHDVGPLDVARDFAARHRGGTREAQTTALVDAIESAL